MAEALGREVEARTKPAESGGSTDGTLAVNEKPSTPRQPADARPERFTSRDPDAFPRPSGREEEWRFTPLKRLGGLLDVQAGGADGIIDGKVVVEVDAAPEVTVSVISPGHELVGSVLTPADRPTALALTGFGQGTLITVPRNTVASAPTFVTIRGEGGTAYGHVVVDVGESAEAVVVLDHVGTATFAGNAEFLVRDNASLTVVSLQDWAPDAIHLGAHAARVGRDARFRSIIVTLGGDLVRLQPTVDYAGRGGSADLAGLYFADAQQHLEHRLFIDHAIPDCRSRVTYKGALQGDEAHTVWIGDVLIRAGATGTDTYELNRNLLLTDHARADSVPNLEIETGEIVGAGHASATGRFDDEQLFYLMARGIPADEATRMVVRGFFADIVSRIGIPAVEERLTSAIEAELERSLA